MARIYRPSLPHERAVPPSTSRPLQDDLAPTAPAASSVQRFEPNVAYGDPDIKRALRISKPTLLRYRRERGLPWPSFRSGQRSFTWGSELNAWVAAREAEPVEFQPVMNRRRRLVGAAE